MASCNEKLETEQKYDFQRLLSELDLYENKPINFSYESTETVKIDGRNTIFFKINELSAQEQYFLRQDLKNVFAGFNNEMFSIAYLVSGNVTGIDIYIGVIKNSNGDVYSQAELLKSQLEGNISGLIYEKLTGNRIESEILAPLQKSRYFGLIRGIPSLTIDEQAQSQGKTINQGIDRLARTLTDEFWQMLIIAKPTNLIAINDYIDNMLQLASDIHPNITCSTQYSYNSGTSKTVTDGHSSSKTDTNQKGTNDSTAKQEGSSKQDGRNKGINSGSSEQNTNNSPTNSRSSTKNKGESSGTNLTTGTSNSLTKSKGSSQSTSTGNTTGESNSIAQGESSGFNRSQSVELVNKKLQRVSDYINDTHINRLENGRSNGFFQTAIYVCAKEKSSYDRLSAAVMAIFQGNQSYFNPLTTTPVHINSKDITQLFNIQWGDSLKSKDAALVTSTPFYKNKQAYASWLTSSELALLAGLPSREVCGIRLRKNVDFSVNPLSPEKDGFDIGHVILNGRQLKSSKVSLDKKLLNQHIFICGVTGSGKTTTCQQLLLKSKLPFLVIEPAKTEYRSLYQLDKDIQFYTLNNEKVSPFRFNPFELLPSEQLLSHIDILKATFAAVFPMEASMPYLIEEAIVKSYESKGWDIHTTSNFFYNDPWGCNGECFPIMSEMLIELEKVIESKNFGMELQEKYRGSLISRLDNLTIGSKGRMLNTRRSIDILSLLKQKVVIELDELKDEQDKALIMGLLIGRVAEAVKHLHQKDHSFRHITLIEEAHRLLEKPGVNDDGAKKMGVNLFANLIAEVRKYGEGLIIADQIPNKLAPEVLKNTNTKIIHRLFAADDRQAIGETVGLDEEQCNFLPMLGAGEAVIYSAGWHGAVRTQINKINDTNAAVLDESIITKHSQNRLFFQRAQLYPQLNEIWITEDAVKFAMFIQEATYVLNLWAKWYHSVCKNVRTQHTNQFLQRMNKHLQVFYEKWKIESEVDSCLAALFIDIAPIPFVEQILPSGYNLNSIMNLLFHLYHSEQLDTKPIVDRAFGLTENADERIVVKAIESIFENLTSI